MANKTKASEQSPLDYIATVEPERRRTDAEILLPWFEKTTGLPAVMWGASTVGFGRYCYKYESGREGEWFMVGFAPRKANMSIHIMPGYQFEKMPDALSRLGKHKVGKGCLYVTRLDAIDLDVLGEIVDAGLANLRENYVTVDR